MINPSYRWTAKRLARCFNNYKLRIVLAAVAQGAFSAIFVFVGYNVIANNDTPMIETESGSLDGSVSVVTDDEASNGQAVIFGETTSPPSGGGTGGGGSGGGNEGGVTGQGGGNQNPPYESNGFGPEGRWPTGFPSYATTANIVTNGTNSGLQSAINSLASSGGVIEHPGNITDATLTRTGSAPIVIRPPLGQRANFVVSGTRIHGSGLLLAGWTLSGSFRVHNAVNSGVAWIEADSSLWFETAANSAGNTAHGLMYELVARQYRSDGDRSRLWSNGAGSSATMDVVGSWLTGSTAPPPAHADTIQVLFQSGGTGVVNINNSVIWPSWDKALQGDGLAQVFTINNSWIAEPSIAESIFPGGGIVLDGHHAITAVASVINSILLGSVHNSYPVTTQGSTLYNVSGIIDGGGNTTVTTLPQPPAAPTHEQLDAIWHP